MTLANPLALGLLLLIVPLLLARLRRPPRRLAVGNWYLWTELAPRQTTAMSRLLQRHRSLLLQIAVVVTVAAALARPLAGVPADRVAIVLDTSMSMAARLGDGSRLDAGKRRIHEELGRLAGKGRIRLWLAGAVVRDAGEFAPDDPRLLAHLEDVQAGGGGAALDEAVRLAANANPAPLRTLVVSDTPVPSGPRGVEWIAVGAPAPNTALTALTARRDEANPARVEVLIRVSNFGSTTSRRELVLEHGAGTLHRETIEVAGRGDAEFVLSAGDSSGVIVARLLPEDDLPLDDERATFVGLDQPLQVRLVSGSRYVRAAIAARDDVSVTPDSVPGTNPDDVIVCDGCRDLPAGSPLTGVLMIPPPTVARESRPLIWHGRPHPLLEGLPMHSAAVVPVASPRSLSPDSVLASAGDLPVLAAYEHDGRRVVELRLDPDRSEFSLASSFPMFVANALDWLAAAHRNPRVLTAGEPLQWMLREPADAVLTLTGPDNAPRPLTGQGSTVTSAATERPGVYHIRLGTRDEAVVVNAVSDNESDLSTVPEYSASPRSTAHHAGQEQRTDLSRALLLVAIALLAFERQQRLRLEKER